MKGNFNVLSQHSSGETEKEHKNISQGGRALDRSLVKFSISHLMCTTAWEAEQHWNLGIPCITSKQIRS